MPTRHPVSFVLAVAVLSVCAGCGGKSDSPAGAGIASVKVDGSSTVYPITEAVAEEFQKTRKGAVRVTVGVSGTGGGFKKFCRGETDISNASRPILNNEMDACKAAGIQYLELPVAYDALTVAVNPQNDWVTRLSVAELKTLWQPAATAKKWKDVNPAWPDAEMKLFGPGADSGTFDYFTEAVNGKAKASRTDYTASEDDNVLVTGIARDRNGLGYFGYAYYLANQKKLKAVPIVNKEGKAVLPSLESVADGSYNPLARPVFIYVNAKSAARPEVKAFVEFYLANAGKLVSEIKYVPLPRAAYDSAAKHFAAGRIGTVFGGKEAVGIKVEELLTRAAQD